MSSNSSKVLKALEVLRGPQKVFKATSKSSKIYQRPQNPVGNQSSSNVHQMVLKSPWNPKIPQVLKRSTRSHQKFQKNLQCFEILRSSGLQKVLKRSTKSSKSQENAQKVPKVLRPQVLNWSSKCPQIPQKVIKALEVLRGPQKVFKATSKSSKSYQRPQNPVVVKSSSNVIKWSSQSPQKFLKTVLKWSTRSHQMFLKCSSMFWDPHVLRSSKSPQKVHKVLKKCQENAQKVPKVLRPQVLNWSSKCPQIPQKVIKALEVLRGPQKVFKATSKSSKIYQRPQSPQYVIKVPQRSSMVLKSPWNPKRPQVLKWSTRSHQKVPEKSSMFEILRSSGLQKVLKRSTKSSKSQENAQKVTKVLRPQVLNWSSKCPQIPQKVIKALEVLRGPQKVFKTTSKSSKSYQRPQNPVGRQKFLKCSSNGPQKVLKSS